MRLAVLGCGSIGQRHIRNLLAVGGVDVVAFDPDSERRAAAASLGVTAVTDVPAALEGASAAIVCSPPAAHLEGLVTALDATAHVLVEKPLADRSEGIAAALDRADRLGCRILVGYSLRFDAGLRRVKEMVGSGAVGRVVAVRAEFGQYLPDWRPAQDYRRGYNASRELGGGVVLDQSHEIDYVRWLVGEVSAVSAVVATLGDLAIEVEDVAAMILRTISGAIAEIHVDSVRRDYSRSCIVEGTDGTIVWDLREGVRAFDPRRGSWEVVAAPADANAMYLEEMRHFLAVVAGDAVPAISGRDGLRVLEIALAAKRSASERREVALA